MNWSNIRLIWFREVRDQLRDRRTIFTIVILPLMLYPLMGMAMLRIAEFARLQPVRVTLIGSEHLPDAFPLLEGRQLNAAYCGPDEQQLVEIVVDASDPPDEAALAERSREAIQRDETDAVVHVPADFSERLQAFRDQVTSGASSSEPEVGHVIPAPTLYWNGASKTSKLAADRIERVLSRYRDTIAMELLKSRDVPAATVRPFELDRSDVSDAGHRRAAYWSDVLPLILLVFALTGAFYPAVDLCAGEKERGTLETLLSSPALRSEIVGGKLLTVMSFSVATALLNLCSSGATGTFILSRMQQGANVGLDVGPPPWSALCLLLVVLLPIAALFSALALAVAAFARSAKEGQYYLMPLLMISLPLMLLPMIPSVKLDMGTSIIPITGLMLWLRAAIEGQHYDALRFGIPVFGVMAGCCWLAVRWAIRQFESENVLFRESERFGLGLWIRHKLRDREDTPTLGDAMLCSLAILLLTFFAGLVATAPDSWQAFVRMTLVTQIGLIALPPLILTLVLTRAPRKTLSLNWPAAWTVPAALLLAAALHPLALELARGIESLYPVGDHTLKAIRSLMAALGDLPWWMGILVMAVTPAICEELAFRGFILSGLRRLGNDGAAIVASSIIFGVSHGLLQQSLSATAVGVVIGFLAVRTGSLLPCMAYHLMHNTLSVSTGQLASAAEGTAGFQWIYRETSSAVMPYVYTWPVLTAGAAASGVLLVCFARLGCNPHGRESSPIEISSESSFVVQQVDGGKL